MGTRIIIISIIVVVMVIVLSLYYSYLFGIVSFAFVVLHRFLKHYFPNDIERLDGTFTTLLYKNKFLIPTLTLILLATIVIIYQNEHSHSKDILPLEFAGVVWDEQNNPLPGVIVELQEISLIDTTDIYGKFYFHTSDSTFMTITIIAYKKDYKTYRAEGSLGNKNFSFVMTKK